VGGSRVNDVFFGHIFGIKRMDRVNQSFDVISLDICRSCLELNSHLNHWVTITNT
jgi:hypothetical protein